jgi:hypothetical protein
LFPWSFYADVEKELEIEVEMDDEMRRRDPKSETLQESCSRGKQKVKIGSTLLCAG